MSTVWNRLVEKATPLSTRTLLIKEQEMNAIVYINQRLNVLEDIVDGLQELIKDNKEILCSQENNLT